MDEDSLSEQEEEVSDVKRHNQLIDAIASLDGKKKNRLSQRSVISNQISEFNFTASKDEQGKVQLAELVGTLQDKSLHKSLRSQIDKIQKKKDVVAVPAPKHEREKIQRQIAYKSTSREVTKWDPIVQQNRLTDQLVFPLEKPNLEILTTDELVETFKPHTPLEVQVAALLGKSDHVIKNKEDELTPAEKKALQAMDVEEALERRRELMKHRALLSYQQARAKRQNKIKSKSYHRVHNKEKRRKEDKVLAEMEKNDPEGFAEKMKLLDKQRIEERMSLKHRGGSKFGQRQKIYAKYDDRAREEVQNMLQLSRELTKKQEVVIQDGVDEGSESGVSLDSEDETNMLESETSLQADRNPWMAPQKIAVKATKSKHKISSRTKPVKVINNETEDVGKEKDDGINKINLEVDDDDDDDDGLCETEKKNDITDKSDEIEDIFKNLVPKPNKSQKSKKKKRMNKKNKTNDEIVTENEKAGEKDLVESGHKNASQVELDKVTVSSTNNQKDKHKIIIDKTIEVDRVETSMVEGLTRKRTLEDFGEESDEEKAPSKKMKESSSNDKRTKNSEKKGVEEVYVDPKKLMTIGSRIHRTGEGLDIIADDDEEEGDDDDDDGGNQRMMIAEAFADDDVVEEFTMEKEEIIEKKKVKDIDLTLPGWGDWGGEGVKPSRKKRIIVKAPKQAERADHYIGHVIINQDKLKDVAKHQVNSLPFPYTTVKQYEASIKAPIGDTWNTPSAFAELVKPKVLTKTGSIINPIDKHTAFENEEIRNKGKSSDPKDKNMDKDKDNSEKTSPKKNSERKKGKLGALGKGKKK